MRGARENIQGTEVLLDFPEGGVAQAQDFANYYFADDAVGNQGDGFIRVAFAPFVQASADASVDCREAFAAGHN